MFEKFLSRFVKKDRRSQGLGAQIVKFVEGKNFRKGMRFVDDYFQGHARDVGVSHFKTSYGVNAAKFHHRN